MNHVQLFYWISSTVQRVILTDAVKILQLFFAAMK